ncbi:unnamed protein product, partial [Ilex paraguariensis]
SAQPGSCLVPFIVEAFRFFTPQPPVENICATVANFEGTCTIVLNKMRQLVRVSTEKEMHELELSAPNFMGGWEGDETVEEAAAREATEEAGVRGVLMGFLGYYHFKSKTRQDECSPEGVCKAAMFSLLVKEELESWPEQNTRRRNWLAIPKAVECCRHPWMRDALVEGFSKWHDEKIDRGKEFSDQD